mmetsp:Transcript_16884/g.46616  ORF Transcript_16884/g.46616 Transcript_16884/m.46616 type:complete len:95 (+) Transcript_16884:971-1255(+)
MTGGQCTSNAANSAEQRSTSVHVQAVSVAAVFLPWVSCVSVVLGQQGPQALTQAICKCKCTSCLRFANQERRGLARPAVAPPAGQRSYNIRHGA